MAGGDLGDTASVHSDDADELDFVVNLSRRISEIPSTEFVVTNLTNKRRKRLVTLFLIINMAGGSVFLGLMVRDCWPFVYSLNSEQFWIIESCQKLKMSCAVPSCYSHSSSWSCYSELICLINFVYFHWKIPAVKNVVGRVEYLEAITRLHGEYRVGRISALAKPIQWIHEFFLYIWSSNMLLILIFEFKMLPSFQRSGALCRLTKQ